MESAMEIQKFMRAYNSKQGIQKRYWKTKREKKYKENKKKKPQEEKTINNLI